MQNESAIGAAELHQIIVRIDGQIVIVAAANFQILRFGGRAVEQVVRIPHTGGEAGAHPGRQHRLASIRNQHQFTAEHIDEFVLMRMPVTQRASGSRQNRDEIDAKSIEAKHLAETPLDATFAEPSVGR